MPAISPASLMEWPSFRSKPESGGMSEFKSTMGPPFSQRKGRTVTSSVQGRELPTICPFELLPKARLQTSSSLRLPRFVTWPSFQRAARSVSSPSVVAAPTTSPESSIQNAAEKVPPSVARSWSDPPSHRNPWFENPSLATSELPQTCPCWFRPVTNVFRPPRLPKSIIRPFSQRKGFVVGTPVSGFGTELVNEMPATWPCSLTKAARASGPPRVPRSCIFPFSQRNARICVPIGAPLGELGDG